MERNRVEFEDKILHSVLSFLIKVFVSDPVWGKSLSICLKYVGRESVEHH